MTSRVHAITGLLGLALIAMFFGASIIVELLADERAIAEVKRLILAGVAVLIPAMVIVGASGRSLGGKRRSRMIHVFASIQAVELLGGAVNITLMSLNLRAGLRLAGRVGRIKVKRPV